MQCVRQKHRRHAHRRGQCHARRKSLDCSPRWRHYPCCQGMHRPVTARLRYLRAHDHGPGAGNVVRTQGWCQPSHHLVEGHGTGTPKGDQIELSALKNVFRDAGTPAQQVAVSSIKTQIGHLKACAGMAGLIKAILAIKHKTLPQSINWVEPPSLYHNGEDSKTDLAISDTPIYINTKMRPWFVPRACHAVLAFHPSDSVVLITTVSSRKPNRA